MATMAVSLLRGALAHLELTNSVIFERFHGMVRGILLEEMEDIHIHPLFEVVKQWWEGTISVPWSWSRNATDINKPGTSELHELSWSKSLSPVTYWDLLLSTDTSGYTIFFTASALTCFQLWRSLAPPSSMWSWVHILDVKRNMLTYLWSFSWLLPAQATKLWSEYQLNITQDIRLQAEAKSL